MLCLLGSLLYQGQQDVEDTRFRGEAPPGAGIGIRGPTGVDCLYLPVVGDVIGQPTQINTRVDACGCPCSITGVIICEVIAVRIACSTTAGFPTQGWACGYIDSSIGWGDLSKVSRWTDNRGKAPTGAAIGIRGATNIDRSNLPIICCVIGQFGQFDACGFTKVDPVFITGIIVRRVKPVCIARAALAT